MRYRVPLGKRRKLVWILRIAALGFVKSGVPSVTQPERIVSLSRQVGEIAEGKISQINQITRETRILALNAMIESARAGELGKGFGVVAGEVKLISERITEIARQLSDELSGSISELSDLGEKLVRDIRGQRLSGLAHTMIDLIDRNLYERSCDVRWWATDPSVVAALEDGAKATHAGQRLKVILDNYTVYLDLWIADAQGRVVAHGRPETYRQVTGTSVAGTDWFRRAMTTRNGGEYVAAPVERSALLANRQVVPFAAAIREGGRSDGRALGVLGIFFDWEPQAAAIVTGAPLSVEEKPLTRCLLVSGNGLVLASSDGQGALSEMVTLPSGHDRTGYAADRGTVTGYALTPGYETYPGMGWYGVVQQQSTGG